MKDILVLLFGRFRWYRKFVGGTWARTTKLAEIGPCLWIPYASHHPDLLDKMVATGEFEYEDYRPAKYVKGES